MAEEKDMTGWSEEEIERGETFMEGFIRACKEVRAMRDGKLPERSLEDFFARMDALIAEETAKENQHEGKAHRVLRG